MKSKKDLQRGVLIGICLIIIPLIFIGATTYAVENNEVGRYQISTTYSGGEYIDYGIEVIIDTKTGEVVSREKRRIKLYTTIKK